MKVNYMRVEKIEPPEELKHVKVGIELINWKTAGAYVAATEDAGANFRKSKAGWIDQIVHMMDTGAWNITPMPIVIDALGNVVDGLHRLRAQMVTKTDRWWIVVRDWPVGADSGIDRNQVRSSAQWLQKHHPEWNITNRSVATVRAAVLGTRVKMFGLKLTDTEYERAFRSCLPLLATVDGNLKGGAGVTGAVRGAFLRAAHYCDPVEIVAAAQIVKFGAREGLQEERDKSMVVLGKYLSQRKFKTSFIHYEEYTKSCSALQAFLNGKVLTKLYGCEKDPFPVDLFDSLLKYETP